MWSVSVAYSCWCFFDRILEYDYVWFRISYDDWWSMIEDYGMED